MFDVKIYIIFYTLSMLFNCCDSNLDMKTLVKIPHRTGLGEKPALVDVF